MHTIGLTAYLISIITKNVKSSAVYALVLRFLIFLKNEYVQSKFYHLILRIVHSVSNEFKSSVFIGITSGRGRLQRAYSNSLLCGLICKLYGVACKLADVISELFKKCAAGGLLDALICKFKTIKFCTFTNVFAAFVACMVVCPHEMWNNLYAVFAAFAFLFVYMVRTYKKLENPDIKSDGFGLTLFTIFVGISVLYATRTADALRIVLFVYSAVIFAFIVRHSINSEDTFMNVLRIIAFGGFVTSVIGIIQRFWGVEVNPEYVDVLVNASMPGRVFSTFANPNNFAELLVLVMPASAALIINSQSRKEKTVWAWFLAIDFIAIGMSYSRSCWVALAIAAVVMLLVYDWKLLVPCIIIFLLVLPLLPESITDRILTIGSMKDTSNASRFYIWDGAWKLAKEYFVSGIGAGPLTFKDYYLSVTNPLATTAPHSHMLYMELVIEFGIVAFIGFISYVLFLVKRAFSYVSKATDGRKAIIGALLGSVAGMSFVFLVEYVWFYPRDMFMFWIILGLLSVSCKSLKKTDFPENAD